MKVYKANFTDALKGTVRISGGKNSVLKLMAASLLSEAPVSIQNAPHVSQTKHFLDTFSSLGVQANFLPEKIIEIKSNSRKAFSIKHIEEAVAVCRHVFLVTTPLIARFQEVTMPIPGFSPYGFRSISPQLHMWAKMGARVSYKQGGKVNIVWPESARDKGNHVTIMTNRCLANSEATLNTAVARVGKTTIIAAPEDPEIVDLCTFLAAIGSVQIRGAGTSLIEIESEGIRSFTKNPISVTVVSDRHEAATYCAAAALVSGEITLMNAQPRNFHAVLHTLHAMGCETKVIGDDLLVRSSGKLTATNIETERFPGFPTDSQGPFMTALTLAKGMSLLREKIWTNRLCQGSELLRMGADIDIIEGNTAMIKGVDKLYGAYVVGTCPRATAGLVLAGLKAEGETTVEGVDLIDNAYDSFTEKLIALGACLSIEDKEFSHRVHPKYQRLEAQ